MYDGCSVWLFLGAKGKEDGPPLARWRRRPECWVGRLANVAVQVGRRCVGARPNEHGGVVIRSKGIVVDELCAFFLGLVESETSGQQTRKHAGCRADHLERSREKDSGRSSSGCCIKNLTGRVNARSMSAAARSPDQTASTAVIGLPSLCHTATRLKFDSHTPSLGYPVDQRFNNGYAPSHSATTRITRILVRTLPLRAEHKCSAWTRFHRASHGRARRRG